MTSTFYCLPTSSHCHHLAVDTEVIGLRKSDRKKVSVSSYPLNNRKHNVAFWQVL